MTQVFLGSDHAGFRLKELLREHVVDQGLEVEDLGAFDAKASVDYPEFGKKVGEKVAAHPGSFGVVVCGSGIGISIAANKVPGVRAALVHDVTTAGLARLHNDANVLALGARIVGEEVARNAVDTFLHTDFEGGRHERRVEQLNSL
jgi:ribose 5-phosphate isomerase B